MPIHERSLPRGVELWSHEPDGHALYPEMLEMLSPDERRRAARFRFDRDRDRFIKRRAFARRILARYLDVAPARVGIMTSAHGRPELEAATGISFNTSHSGALVVVAVARGRRVGVDIERVRPISGAMDIATRFFTPAESAYLKSDLQVDPRAFLTIWTRKESYAKAVGKGLGMPFDRFDVSTSHRDQTGRPRGPRGDARYTFTSLDTIDGYVAAVTVSDENVGAIFAEAG